MIIAGLRKTSLIDYPGKLSGVLFLPECNFECPYCHNPELVRPDRRESHHLSEKAVYAFLESRKHMLDGIVISGGEPTLQNDLNRLCEKIKGFGYPVKLDTNGSHPRALKRLVHENLIDYIAMDIKTDPFLYEPVISKSCKAEWILSSIETILESSLPCEFRTTCVKPIVNERTIEVIAKTIKGKNRYVLQRFHHRKVLKPRYFEKEGSGCQEYELVRLKSIAESWVGQCIIR